MYVDYSGNVFNLDVPYSKQFVNLGESRNNRGNLNVFYNVVPNTKQLFKLGDRRKISGYCSYYLAYSNVNILCGVLFTAFKTITKVEPFKLLVSASDKGQYEPLFILEKMNLLVYRTKESSVLVIPSKLNSSMIVTADSV